MKKALITGITGQDGSYLTEFLLSKGYEVQPDIIFHFAFYVLVFSSFKNPLPVFQTNIIGMANLLEAIKKIVPETKILIIGSGEEYGNVPQDKMPIKEDYPLNPVYNCAMDFDFFVRASEYGKFKHVKDSFGNLRVHGNSKTVLPGREIDMAIRGKEAVAA